MWELDYKESWALKNWCFWTVGEDFWESLSKEIQPVHPKGNQSWMFIGRTDDVVETPILWPPDTKNWLIGKDPDAENDWRWEETRSTEDEMVGWHHQLNRHELVMDREAWCALVHEVAKSRTWLSNWTELNWFITDMLPGKAINKVDEDLPGSQWLRRWAFDPWSRKIPWRRPCQPTPVFLSGKFHGPRSLAGYSPWGWKRVRHDLATNTSHNQGLGESTDAEPQADYQTWASAAFGVCGGSGVSRKEQIMLSYFLKILFLFIFGCVVLLGLFPSWGEQGLPSSCGSRASHCSDFSWCRTQALSMWAQQLQLTGSRGQGLGLGTRA